MTIRVGFIGVGGVAQVHLENMKENNDVEIVAVCDVIAKVAESTAHRYGAVPYTDYNKLLTNEQLDALFICVPPFAHQMIEEKAAARGIHLFVEKPIGLDIYTVHQKYRSIKEAGIITATGYCLRYLDIVRKAKKYLADKTVGMARGYYLTTFVETPWWRNMNKSGGQFVEQTTHTVDLMRYLIGDVQKVYADMALRVMDDTPGIDIPDVGSINFVFDSGAIGNITTSFTQPDHRSGIEILGRGFSLLLDEDSLVITEEDGQQQIDRLVDFRKEQDDTFIQAIMTGNRDLILAPYEEALATLLVTFAANQSADSGSPVYVDSLLEKRSEKNGIY
jgi:predicted dehydrogenase